MHKINQKVGVVNLEDYIDNYKDKYGDLNITTIILLGGNPNTDFIKTNEIMDLDKAIDLYLTKAKFVELFTIEQALTGPFIERLHPGEFRIVYNGLNFIIQNWIGDLRIALEDLSADMDQTDENTTNDEFKVHSITIIVYS